MRSVRVGYKMQWGILVGILLASVWTTALAATPDPWVVVVDGSQDETAAAIVTDATGNVYVTGSFRGTVDFDPGPGQVTRTSNNSTAAYVAKYDPSGAFVWVGIMSGGNVYAHDIVLDNYGYIGVTGSFEGDADLDPGPDVHQFTSKGSQDIFLVRLDPNGHLDWGFSAGDDRSDVGYAVTVDRANYFYIAGSFEGDADFDPGPGQFIVSSEGEDDAFIARFNSNGERDWVRTYGGDGDDEGRDVGVNAGEYVYLTGVFEGRVDLDASYTEDERRSKGKEDIFVTILTKGGNHSGALQIGGRGSDIRPQIWVESTGTFYLGGEFSETADFDADGGGGTATSNGDTDFFLFKYSYDRKPVWVYTNGGGGSDTLGGISRDFFGNIYITGAFEGTVNFDPSRSDTTITSAGQDDIYIASFTANGTVREVRALRGVGDAAAGVVANDRMGNVLVSGDFDGTLDLDNGLTAAADPATGDHAAFIAKLSNTDWLPGLTTLFLPNTARDGAPAR